MTLLAALFLYPSTFVLGFLFARVLGVKNLWEKLSVGWLLGTALTTYLYFLLYDYLGVHFTTLSLTLLLLGLIALFASILAVTKQYSWQAFKGECRQHFLRIKDLVQEKNTLVLLLLLLIPIVFGIVLNLRWPVMDWDALALYDYRAKVFSMSGGIEDGIIRGYFLHYPLYTSMLHTFSYLFGIQSARIWYSFFYITSLIVFYELLQRHVSQKQALVGAFILAVSPMIFQHSQMTYTNLSHALYLALGYIYLWEWWRKGSRVDLLVGASMIAASTWVRLTEPLWIPAFGMLFIGWWRWKSQLKYIIVSALLIYFIRYPWIHFVAVHDNLSISNPLQIGGGLQLPSHPWDLVTRVAQVYNFFWISIFPVFGQYVPPLFIAGLYALYKEKWSQIWEYGFFLILILFICGGIFLFSFQFKGWQDIPDSAARMSMFLIPIAIYLLMKSELWLLPHKKTP